MANIHQNITQNLRKIYERRVKFLPTVRQIRYNVGFVWFEGIWLADKATSKACQQAVCGRWADCEWRISLFDGRFSNVFSKMRPLICLKTCQKICQNVQHWTFGSIDIKAQAI
ncbi:hypothetical protein [Moraxella caviae]|uniref:hypothetical protein n=1 Tax=Moraxella caviae TaxID=34060 RepID=UPI00117D9CB0|nr:hypothetical protein [Moraxella caviae]